VGRTNDPFGKGGGPAIKIPDDDLAKPDAASKPRFFWTTYPERLEARGKLGGLSGHGRQFHRQSAGQFPAIRAAYRGDPGSRKVLAEGAFTRALDALRADVLADRLPQISWVVGTAEGSEHPGPSSPAQGAAYRRRDRGADRQPPSGRAPCCSSISTRTTAFRSRAAPARPRPMPICRAVLPGQHGFHAGEYTPAAPGAGGRSGLRGRPYGLGPRVPMYVLSPWSRGGRVFSEVSDHTSVIRFMEAASACASPTSARGAARSAI
jgi:phospholipase C